MQRGYRTLREHSRFLCVNYEVSSTYRQDLVNFCPQTATIYHMEQKSAPNYFSNNFVKPRSILAQVYFNKFPIIYMYFTLFIK